MKKPLFARYLIHKFKREPFWQQPEYVVSDEKQVVYLVNSKAACSSIKASFLGELRPDIPDDYSVHYITTQSGFLKWHLDERQKKYFRFTFVRNPFSRLVSCYESKYHVDMKHYGKKKNDFEDYLDGYLAKDEGFEVFVDKVCSLPESAMDKHFRPQYRLILAAFGPDMGDFIGHFENLAEEYEPIRSRFGLAPLKHYNRTPSEKWMDYYTEETAHKIYRKFKKDVVSFGYGDSFEELLRHIREKGK